MFAWAALACLLPSERWTALVSLTGFWLVGFAHALQHLYHQLAWEGLAGYAPGFLASAALIIPATLLVTWHALTNRLIGWPLVIGLGATSAFLFAGGVRAGHRMPAFVHTLFGAGQWIAEALFE